VGIWLTIWKENHVVIWPTIWTENHVVIRPTIWTENQAEIVQTDFEGELDGDFPVDFVGDTCDSVRFQRDLDVGDLEGECDDLVAAEALGVMASV
jgi:hypothetical protein